MNDVTFTRGNGALGRPLASRDHVSAICMPVPDANLPSGFSTTDRIKLIYSLADAEALGIRPLATNLAHSHYQISEVFRLNPKAELYVYLYDSAATTAAVYLQPVIEFPENGEIRNASIFKDAAIAGADITDIQSVVTAMRLVHRPFSAIVGFSAYGAANDWSTAIDLRALEADGVGVVIGGSGSGLGLTLATTDNNIPAIGAVLGATSKAGVHESIAYVAKFNFSNGVELEKTVIGDKSNLVNDQTEVLLSALTAKGYIFFRKHMGITGSYINDSSNADLITSDYAYGESTRTIDKAIRGVRTFLLPQLSSPVYLNENGTMREDTVANFRALALRSLDQMQQAGEISARDVTIDPTQAVLSTSKLVIGVKIVPVGVARNIEVNIAFALKVS
tara:strand:- start:299 stop:1474 length:1176 start_codon:yes stop_codon:yes gene_type:complete